MQRPLLIEALRPNVASLGYGLFLAINAASVWGGSFPFLPMDFQTSEVLFWFFLAQSVVFTLSFFASAVGTYLFPSQTRVFLVKVVVAPYMLGWGLLIAAIYFPEVALPFSFAGGGLLGLGSAGFYMLWQRLFASQDSREGNQNLIVGTAWATILYFALYLIPVAVTAYLIPLVFLPLFSLAVVLKSRTIDLDQPMFEDVPSEHPRTYRHIISRVWRTALAIGALGFCTGIMRAFAVADPSVGSLVNVLSMAATLAASVALLAAWTVKSLRFNVWTAYRIFFPLVTTAFLLLPLLSSDYARILAAVLYALWSVAIMLMMIQCAQVSRDGGINPVFIYGIFGGIVYLLHDVGFIGGHYVESLMVAGIPPTVLVAVVAIYLLGLMYFVGQGGFRQVMVPSAADEIELLALRRKAKLARLAQAKAGKARAGDAGNMGNMGNDGGAPGAEGGAEAASARAGVGAAAGAGASATRVATGAGASATGTAAGAGTAGVAAGVDAWTGTGAARVTTGAASTRDTASTTRMAADIGARADVAAGAGATGAWAGADAEADAWVGAGAGVGAQAGASAGFGVDAENARPGEAIGSTDKPEEDVDPKRKPDEPGEVTYRDRFSKQMAAVADQFGLSARETEVAELIARGNSVARIAEVLIVSENTIRTHSKRIYTKLDIHKRQELIELVESFDPSDR